MDCGDAWFLLTAMVVLPVWCPGRRLFPSQDHAGRSRFCRQLFEQIARVGSLTRAKELRRSAFAAAPFFNSGFAKLLRASRSYSRLLLRLGELAFPIFQNRTAGEFPAVPR